LFKEASKIFKKDVETLGYDELCWEDKAKRRPVAQAISFKKRNQSLPVSAYRISSSKADQITIS